MKNYCITTNSLQLNTRKIAQDSSQLDKYRRDTKTNRVFEII